MSLVTGAIVRTLPLMPRALVWRVARRYVAGPTLADAVATVRRLNAEGAMATVDVLGEEVTEAARATAAVEEYVRALDAIVAERLDSNISIKPTMFGLKIDERLCAENVERLVAAARDREVFVRIDMEDRSTTDFTLRLYRDLQARYGNVGVVLQAYMRRTLGDIDGLPAAGANVRLCKGIYVEPREVAWKGYETVRAAFVAALEKLLERGVYTGIATHDEYLVAAGVTLADRLRVPRERHEFQMLLGVEDELRRILVARGHRLRENPAIAGHVMRAFLGLKPKAE